MSRNTMKEHGERQPSCLLYSEDRHFLFSSPPKGGPAAVLAARGTALLPPDYRSGGRAKSTQAIVVLCSAAKEDDLAPGEAGHGGQGSGGGGTASISRQGAVGTTASSASSVPAERWCSWADHKPVPREKLVEEQLARTHKGYCRLFQQHGGGPRIARGSEKQEKQPCRACFDPTLEHLMTVVLATRCLTSERVFFHYMHHHAPSAVALRDEGRLLLYCQDSNEHRPLSLDVVHEQLRAPAVYIFDCPHAGRLVRALDEQLPADADVIALGSCSEAEALPWGQLGLPADLFTACLVSPVRTALSFYRARGAAVISEQSLGALRLVRGNSQDRGTPLGELLSVFTAVADAIAWSSFPPRVFWRLFRGDGAVAEICRNFLLAARILHYFGLHAASRPVLPATHGHHLWDVWDSTLELFLVQLSHGQSSPGPRSSLFFDEQMAAFSVWLRFQPPLGGQDADPSRWCPEPPAELPIMLQGLLHASCRVQALHLLAYFVDLGIWAVHLTLLVGARPYLTKLLSHDDPESAPEVAGLALIVWTKILVSDGGKDGLPGKDTCRSFFKLVGSEHLSSYHRSLASLCLAIVCRDRANLQLGCLQLGLLDHVIEILSASQPWLLRWMTVLLCAEACRGCAKVAHAALHSRVADLLLAALQDASPEVRASAIYAIGNILAALPPSASHSQVPEIAGAGATTAAGMPVSSRMPAVPGDACRGDAAVPCTGIGALDSATASSETLPPLSPGAAQAQQDSRWFWLAHSSMWRFCREPLVDMPLLREHAGGGGTGPGPSGHAILDCTILNETSALVRYELVCALAPWLCDLAANPTGGLATLGGSPPAWDLENSIISDPGDEANSVSSASSGCASMPTLNPVKSPHMRPNSSLFAVPVAAAHQAERRFMHLLAQDPVLLALGSVRRIIPVPGCVKVTPRRQFGAPLGGGRCEPTLEPLRKVASESCLAGMRQGLGADEDDVDPSPEPEPIIYAWTINYLQQPNVLARLREAAPEFLPGLAGEHSVDISRPGLCSSHPLGAATAGVPACPWGVPFLSDGQVSGGLADCRPITLPAKPCPPFLLPGSRRNPYPAKHLRAWSMCNPAKRDSASASGGVSPWLLSISPHGPTAGGALGYPCPSCSSEEREGARGDAGASAAPSLVLDVKVSEPSRGEAFRVCESWEPFPAGALCFHAVLPMCLARGRRGQITVVNYRDAANPQVHTLDLHQIECARRPPATPGDPQMHGSRRGGGEELAAINQMTWINEHNHGHDDPHRCLLCCATDDGTVHICQCWGCEHHQPRVVCTFQALPRRRNAALCVHWLQRCAQLVAAGRDPHIRIWDLAREQMVRSFRHNSMHCVTCVTQGSASELDSATDGTCSNLVFIGRGDGSLLVVDPRTRAGLLQSHKSQLESVTSITPGVRSSSDGQCSPYLVASSDNYGMVDLWDLRAQRSQACYQLGVSKASERRPYSEFERVPVLCQVPAHGGLIAAVRLLSSLPQVATLTELSSGEQRLAFPLHKDVQPSAMGIHPNGSNGCMFGILSQTSMNSRLLLYSNAGRYQS